MSHGSKKQVRFHTFLALIHIQLQQHNWLYSITYTGYCGLYDTVRGAILDPLNDKI